MATVDADDGEESGGAKDIFEDVDVMKYLKDGEVKVTWSTKERSGSATRQTVRVGEDSPIETVA
jgi:hypothetical protein